MPPGGAWGPDPSLPPRSDLTGAEGDKSPSTAGLLSAFSTLAPIGIGFTFTAFAERNAHELTMAGLVMVSTGAVLGPSIGHFYAGEPGRGLGMTGLRLLAFGNAVGLSVLGIGSLSYREYDDGYGGGSNDSTLGIAMIGFGAASGCAGLGLMILDLNDAPSAARRANREAREATDDQAALPALSIAPGGGALTWTF